MERRIAYLAKTGLVLLAVLSAGASGRRDPAGHSRRGTNTVTPVELKGLTRVSVAAGAATALLANYTFDDGLGGPDRQGWISEDVTASRDTFFHVDDFAGLSDPAYTPITGTQSLWCGARSDSPDTTLCNYATLPGYGNSWDQNFESTAFATTGDVTLQFFMRFDTEPGYDYVYVEFEDENGNWETMNSYAGKGETTFVATAPADTLNGSVRFRIRFQSDGAWSDEDGLWPTSGAVIVDSIVVIDSTGTIDTQDFESESVGATATADGDWSFSAATLGFGDYSGLFDGTTVLQEDSLVTDTTYLWGFFNGSTDVDSCDGHPEQLAVPQHTAPLPERDQAIDNRIQSPWIDLTVDHQGMPLAFSPDSIVLETDVYLDNPLDNLVFYTWKMRFFAGGCQTPWQNYNFVYYGDQKQWVNVTFGLPVVPGATHVQVTLEVVDMCPLWCGIYGTGACHTHAPLFDNVRVHAWTHSVALVTNTNDAGPGSLRQAIMDANASPDVGTIMFNIPGPGPHTVRPDSMLPAITAPVKLDGYSQPGSSPNTAAAGLPGNAVILVEIDGSNAGLGADGLFVNADSCLIRGLAVNRFDDGSGISIGGRYNTIEGNFIGTNPAGTQALGNGGVGILAQVGAPHNTVGGTSPAARNVISSNTLNGVRISSGADSCVVQGNFIGTDISGTQDMGNTRHGVRVSNASHNTIGGATPGAGNLIAYNGKSGVRVKDIPCIANVIRGNRIVGNDSLGIDLGVRGVDPNDAGDADTGPNNLQNYPVLASAVTAPGSTRVTGSFGSSASTAYTLEFFASSTCDPSGHGEGETVLGSIALTTDVTGAAAIDVTLPAGAPAGGFVTATAMDPAGNTSEFSACIVAVNTPPGSTVTTTPVDSTGGGTPVTLTFDNVTSGGATTLSTSGTGPALPGTFITGDSTYYNLSTTATYTGSIEVCIQYDETNVTGSESNLRLVHYDTTLVPADWVDITTSVDTVSNVICGMTATLSPFAVARIKTATGIGDTPVLPARFALYQNTPNPFNPSTVIRYDVPAGGGRVTLRIYDVAGRLVRTLVDGQRPPGRAQAIWRGRNDRGAPVATGVYFYRMTAGRFTSTRKLVLLK